MKKKNQKFELLKKNLFFFRCKKCLVTSTRPRVKFKKGICSGCLNFEERKKINWKKRFSILKKICKKLKSQTGAFDVIVPVGGGKDSSYVAWYLKNKLGMNPLCVFCEPPLMTKIGKENLSNFENSGFSVLKIYERKIDRKINKVMFQKFGFAQYSWLAAIKVVPIKIALQMNIKLIMWGEEGESMYGGVNKYRNNLSFKPSRIKKFYLESLPVTKFFKQKDLGWINLSKKEVKLSSRLYNCNWSFFEKWDENMHLKVAKKFCGLKDAKFKEQNAINKHSHTDQKMFSLHMYLAYLKFGFSRATSDTSIEIRHGRITRKHAKKIVNKYDSIFPNEYLTDYCKYFKMNKKQFLQTLEKFRNKKIFDKSKKLISN